MEYTISPVDQLAAAILLIHILTNKDKKDAKNKTDESLFEQQP